MDNVAVLQDYLRVLEDEEEAERRLKAAKKNRAKMEKDLPWLKEVLGKIEANTPSALQRRRDQKEKEK
jgi:hypothetical protein